MIKLLVLSASPVVGSSTELLLRRAGKAFADEIEALPESTHLVCKSG